MVLSMETVEYINKVNDKLERSENREEAFKELFGT